MAAIQSNGQSAPFDDLRRRSSQTATELASRLHVRAGDKIVLALENGIEHVELLLAAWQLGLQVVVVPPTISRGTLDGLIDKLSPVALAIDARNERLRDPSRTPVHTLRYADDPSTEVWVSSPAPSQILDEPIATAGSIDWRESLAAAPPPVFYTSGSTSTAKGVLLTWSGVLAKGRDVLAFYAITERDRLMIMVPLSHVYGLYLLIGALDAGADVIAPRESANLGTFADALVTHEASMLVCPPSLGEFMFGRRTLDDELRRTLRLVSMGGAATPPGVTADIVRNLPNARVFLSYGLAETFSTICCNEVSLAGADYASVGPLRFGAHGSVRDPGTLKNVPLARDTAGELCVGGTVMSGYLDLEGDYFTADGLFRTGDLVEVDDRLNIFIKGRLKEIINVGALSVYPSEVEEAMMGHPAVLDCGVFGAHAGSSEVIHAAVVLRTAVHEAARDALVDSIYQHCVAQLSPKMVPRKIFCLDAIPRGSLGKILRVELRTRCTTSDA